MSALKKLAAMKYILLLDAVLIALGVWQGFRLHRQWLENAARFSLSRIVPPSETLKKVLAMQKSPAELEKNYMVIATRNPFSPDRSDVLEKVEAKPRPPKPILYGILNLQDTKLAMMSSPDRRDFKSLHVGDPIGEYTLTKILVNTVELKWETETVTASTEEQPRVVAAPSTAALPGATTGGKVVSVESSTKTADAEAGSAKSNAQAAPAGQCKGKWIKTLFGMVCSEEGK